MKLPKPPAEVPACRDVTLLAPRFRDALDRTFARLVGKGWHPCVIETDRSNERALFLYGFGRDYDDDRGVVTNAKTANGTWHHFRLAADVGDRRFDPEHTPKRFYVDLEQAAEAEGLTSGADWNRNNMADEHFCDLPHVQWWCEGMHVSPSPYAAELLASGGYLAVWQALHAA